jgi:broad specificity phosphatase PhoE
MHRRAHAVQSPARAVQSPARAVQSSAQGAGPTQRVVVVDLFRHAYSCGNLLSQMPQAPSNRRDLRDPVLTDTGWLEATQHSATLPAVQRLYSSHLRRAFETAKCLNGSRGQPVHMAPFLAESGSHGDNQADSRDLSSLLREDRRRIRVQTQCGRPGAGGAGSWTRPDRRSLRLPCSGDTQPDVQQFLDWLAGDLQQMRQPRSGSSDNSPLHVMAVSHANTLRRYAHDAGARTLHIGNLAQLRCTFLQDATGVLHATETPRWLSMGIMRRSTAGVTADRCAATASGAKVFRGLRIAVN